MLDLGEHSVIIQTWYQTATLLGAPIIAQVLWSPTRPGGVGKSFQILRDRWSDRDVSAAAKGMRLLHNLSTIVVGRPKRSGHWRTAADLEAEVGPLIDSLRNAGKHPAKERVAGLLSDQSLLSDESLKKDGGKVTLRARVKRLERATKTLLGKTWDEYVTRPRQGSLDT